MFYILKKPIKKYLKKNNEVNIVAALNNNNGIKGKGISNENTFEGNKIVLITGGNGGAGLAFYLENDFNRTSSTIVLSPKNIKLNKNIGKFISVILSENKKKYSYSYQWNKERIYKEKIKLPIKENEEIDYDFIENIIENL